jgi:hypothetical protein
MAPAVPFEFAIDLDCSDAGKQPCYILLPHRSLLGTFENGVIQPKGGWPLTFLCLRHERVSVRSADSIRFSGPEPVRGLPFLLWRVAYECGREDCGKRNVLHIGPERDAETIKDRLTSQRYKVPCDNHSVEWRRELIRVRLLAHDPHMR